MLDIVYSTILLPQLRYNHAPPFWRPHGRVPSGPSSLLSDRCSEKTSPFRVFSCLLGHVSSCGLHRSPQSHLCRGTADSSQPWLATVSCSGTRHKTPLQSDVSPSRPQSNGTDIYTYFVCFLPSSSAPGNARMFNSENVTPTCPHDRIAARKPCHLLSTLTPPIGNLASFSAVVSLTPPLCLFLLVARPLLRLSSSSRPRLLRRLPPLSCGHRRKRRRYGRGVVRLQGRAKACSLHHRSVKM